MPHYADTTQYSIQEISLWERMREKQGKVFHTAKGLSFTYNIQGNELFISRKQKSITRATVNMAYKKVRELGSGRLPAVVKGPKMLGVFGASYLYAIFVEVGVINTSPTQHTTNPATPPTPLTPPSTTNPEPKE